MNFPVELLQKYSGLKSGKVFYGEFAKDGSFHAAIVVTIHSGMVNYFCFTSQELTIKRYNHTDPLATITLTEDETRNIFPDSTKTTYIYCGKSNWGRLPEEDFLKNLSDGIFTLRTEISSNLLIKIKNAIKNSKTMSEKSLKDMGLL